MNGVASEEVSRKWRYTFVRHEKEVTVDSERPSSRSRASCYTRGHYAIDSTDPKTKKP